MFLTNVFLFNAVGVAVSIFMDVAVAVLMAAASAWREVVITMRFP